MLPDGFVDWRRRDKLAFFVHTDTGTLPNTATMTAVCGSAAAFFLDFNHSFGTDLVGTFKASSAEVACGQSAGFIQDIDQDVGSVGRETLSGNGVTLQTFCESFYRSFEFGVIFRCANGRCAARIKHNGLDAF